MFPGIYDTHIHVGWHAPGVFEGSRGETLLRDMDRAGVLQAWCCHTSALWTPSRGNRDTLALVRSHPERLRGLMVVYPQYPEVTSRALAEFDSNRRWWIGLKLHPSAHRHPLSGTGYERALAFADERRLIVLVHTWGDGHIQEDYSWQQEIRGLNGHEELRRVLERYHDAIFIAGHSLNGHWDHAAKLVRGFPNLFLEISTVNDRGAIAWLCERAGSDRILFGSDYPFVSMRYTRGTVEIADITGADRENIFRRNVERLLARVEKG